ncbi:3-oxoacyl-ACP synthase III family protein [Peredibacter starrii]|uniref:Beta-ketoacyl-ACP synthase III n=1 Tax=Peredibacter starrii TaxID=28202 RepID=A0AAX4HV84_9BACT|nr:beta-ketoacyl-ACP synthase III [Peredibacter starrii]WPU67118.1 beta-ketoacyl-ACP synthase III [Peredibacter starrii]
MYSSEIIGTGMYVPPGVVTNHDLEKLMETSHDWIVQRSGIEERRWVTPEVGTTDLALRACEEAIKNAGIDKKEIDCILFATLSPDHDFPGAACFLQPKLGLTDIPAIDVRQQCSGFIYAMSIADAFIKTGQYKTVLVVGAEVHSKGLDKTTRGRDVAVLFGDGAGAIVMRRTDVKDPKKDSHVWSTHLYTEGAGAKELWLEVPGMALGADRITHDMLEKGLHYPQMNGKKVFANAVRRLCECTMTALKANNLTLDDIDLFLFHQANMRINQMVAQELKIPEEKVFNTIQKFGNTTAATIPIGMAEAVKAGKLKKGSLVASAVFGSGFTWASSVYRW